MCPEKKEDGKTIIGLVEEKPAEKAKPTKKK
jgi:hypothetical protein